MTSVVSIDLEVAVTDRNGKELCINSLDEESRAHISVEIDHEVLDESDLEILQIVRNDYNLTAKELTETLEAPAVTLDNLEDYVLSKTSSAFKLQLVRKILQGS